MFGAPNLFDTFSLRVICESVMSHHKVLALSEIAWYTSQHSEHYFPLGFPCVHVMTTELDGTAGTSLVEENCSFWNVVPGFTNWYSSTIVLIWSCPITPMTLSYCSSIWGVGSICFLFMLEYLNGIVNRMNGLPMATPGLPVQRVEELRTCTLAWYS
jgi:hypothetical protein